MDVRVEDLGPVSKRLSFTIPSETVGKGLDRTYEALRQEVKLPGFRKGKVPRKVLEEHFATEAAEQTAEDLVREVLPKALVDHELQPVAEPTVEKGKLRKGKPFEFTATVELMPDIAIAGYDGLRYSVEAVQVRDEDVEKHLHSMRLQSATFDLVTEDQPVGDGDVGEVTMTLRAEGYPDHSLEGLRVGVPDDTSADFLRELVAGLRRGESRSGAVTVPMSYPDPTWAGAQCEATVELTGLARAQVPELDDDLAKRMGLATLAELRAAVREQLGEAVASRARVKAERALLEQLMEGNPFEPPPAMVERRAQTLVRAIGAELMPGSLGSQGPSLDDLEADRKRDVLAEADFAVRRELVLQEIARREQLEVSEEDRQRRIDGIAQQTGQSSETVRSYLTDRGGMDSLDARLLEDRALALLVERAAKD